MADHWLAITNAICNTVQVLGLAYIAQMVQRDVLERRRNRRHDQINGQ